MIRDIGFYLTSELVANFAVYNLPFHLYLSPMREQPSCG